MDLRKTEVTLDPSEIPYDITFAIEECGSEVKAHKLIMAMGSPVCVKQFYGELKEIEGKIIIKGILSWSANFLYVRELILLSSETYFVSKSEVSLILNQAKTENLGTSSALKSGYPEDFFTNLFK